MYLLHPYLQQGLCRTLAKATERLFCPLHEGWALGSLRNDHVAVGSWGILFLCCRTCPGIASILFLFFMTSLQREKSSPGVLLQVRVTTVCVLWLWSGVCVLLIQEQGFLAGVSNGVQAGGAGSHDC